MKQILLISLFMLSACSTSNQFKIADYETVVEKKLPGISVFYKTSSDKFNEACHSYSKKSLLHDCQMNTIDISSVSTALKKSDIFQRVGYADNQSEYQLLITSARYNHEGADELGSAIISGATLLLIPMSISTLVKIEANLTWRGVIIKEYKLELPFTAKISLFNNPKNAKKDFANSLSSHLIQEFQKDNIFSPIEISKKLKATDYTSELTVPDLAGTFIKDELLIYNHPYQGAQVRYLHNVFKFNYIDVFVYPVRHWSWDDAEKTLRKEVVNFQKDIELMDKEGNLKSIYMGDGKISKWKIKGNDINVISVDSEFENDKEGRFLSKYYLMLMKDKFVKIRASYEKENGSPLDVKTFAHAVANKIQVPEESLFMTKMRNQWRKNSIH